MPKRVTDERAEELKKAVASLKSQAKAIGDLGDLKNQTGWLGLKEILNGVVKNQESRVRVHLQGDYQKGNYFEAAKCEARKVLAEYILAVVEKNDDHVADINEQILAMNEKIKAYEANELID